MRPTDFWLGVLSLLAVAATAPAWVFFSGTFLSGLPVQIRWLAALVLPATLLLLLASWVDPGGVSA